MRKNHFSNLLVNYRLENMNIFAFLPHKLFLISSLFFNLYCYVEHKNDKLKLQKQWTYLHDQRINKNIATSL